MALIQLVEFTLSSRFGLFLPSYAGLLVMLSLTDFLLDTSLCTVSLKSAQRAVQTLVIFYDYVRHSSHLTSLQLCNECKKQLFGYFIALE